MTNEILEVQIEQIEADINLKKHKLANKKKELAELESAEKSPADEYLRSQEKNDYLGDLSEKAKHDYSDRDTVAKITVNAHNAGQAITQEKYYCKGLKVGERSAAQMTHEIYRPLMSYLNSLTVDIIHNKSFPFEFDHTTNVLIKNINQPTQEEDPKIIDNAIINIKKLMQLVTGQSSIPLKRINYILGGIAEGLKTGCFDSELEDEPEIIADVSNWEWCNLANETTVYFQMPGKIEFDFNKKYKLTPID